MGPDLQPDFLICSQCGRVAERAAPGACPACGAPLAPSAAAATLPLPLPTPATVALPQARLPVASPPGAATLVALSVVASSSQQQPQPPPGSGTGGTPLAAPPVAEGEAFGRYRLLREIGRGGMGRVFQAWDTQLNRTVALKLLLAEAAATSEEVERFLREARAAARLRHPGIVPVHDVGSTQGRNYFTMDFIEGESLESAKDRLTTHRFVEILRDVALALQAAHEAGVIHRDVKPGNILLDAAGRAYVTDFGLAKEVRTAAGRPTTATGTALGTPQYMAPEQARGRNAAVGPASDVWSLGVMLYEHLAGRVPFVGAGALEILLAIVSEEPRPPSRAVVVAAAAAAAAAGRPARPVPPDLETVCLKCLEKDPARRYASAADFATELARFLAGEPVRARPISATARLVRRLARARAVLLPTGAAVLLALALAIAVHFVRAGAAANEALRREAEAARRQADAEREVEQLLGRAESLWREAKAVLYSTALPLERYHEKLRAALALYDEASARLPRNGWIYEARGRVRIQVNDLAGAEADLRQAADLLGPEAGKAARRSLGRVDLERAFDLLYFGADAGSSAREERAAALRAQALAELRASAGPIAWRGTQEEGEGARRLAEGLSAWANGDGVTAARIFREGVDRATDEECAWGMSIVTTGAERERWCERALQIRPRYVRALLDRATARLGRDDFGGAIADTTAVLAIDPTCVAALTNRGVARRATGDLAGALADDDAALRIDPANAVACHNRGNARWDRGDRAGARADFDAAIRLEPGYAQAYARRGHLRSDLGDLEGALADLDAALRLAPALEMARTRRAYVRVMRADAAGARADATAVLRIDPSNAEAHGYLADALRLQGDAAAALAEYDAALRLEPGNLNVAVNRATLLADKGDARAAIAVLTQALQIRPAEPVLWYDRGYAHEQLDELDAAGRDFDEALRLKPDYVNALERRAGVRLRREDFAGAIADLAAAARARPKDPDVRYNLACACARAAAGKEAGAERARLIDQAFEHLDLAVAAGYRNLAELTGDADLASLHADPRWSALVARLGGGK